MRNGTVQLSADGCSPVVLFSAEELVCCAVLMTQSHSDLLLLLATPGASVGVDVSFIASVTRSNVNCIFFCIQEETFPGTPQPLTHTQGSQVPGNVQKLLDVFVDRGFAIKVP